MEKEEIIKTAYNECMKVCKDEFLLSKLNTCLSFLNNEISVSEARKTAFECHKYARELKDKNQIFLARACGHAIATIHVKEHLKPCLDYLKKYEISC
jgi:hypothetical protein